MRWPWRVRNIVSTFMAAALISCAFVLGCGGSDDSSRSGAGAGADRFPAESLRDWVSYADHVAIFSVVTERELPASNEDLEHGGGLQGREVTLRIERKLWSAPNAPDLPGEIKMRALGWVLQEGQRLPMTTGDAPRVAVGEKYLAPVVQVEGGDGALEWWPLTVGSQLPLGDSRVTSPGRDAWRSPMRDALSGRSVDEIAELLKAQRPDPVAEKFSSLRPTERIQAVLAHKRDVQAADQSSRTDLRALRRRCDRHFRPLDHYAGPAEYAGAPVSPSAMPRIAAALKRMRPKIAAVLDDQPRARTLLRLLRQAQRAAGHGRPNRMLSALERGWLVADRIGVPECHIGSQGRPS
jgi:hypothetical protein